MLLSRCLQKMKKPNRESLFLWFHFFRKSVTMKDSIKWLTKCLNFWRIKSGPTIEGKVTVEIYYCFYVS